MQKDEESVAVNQSFISYKALQSVVFEN